MRKQPRRGVAAGVMVAMQEMAPWYGLTGRYEGKGMKLTCLVASSRQRQDRPRSRRKNTGTNPPRGWPHRQGITTSRAGTSGEAREGLQRLLSRGQYRGLRARYLLLRRSARYRPG